MFELLYRPFPPFFSGKPSLRSSLITGLVVFGILFVLQPFGLDIYDTPKRAFTAAIYGIATFLVSMIFLIFLPILIPKLFDGLRWTVGKEIMFFIILLVCLSVANAGINMWLQSVPFSFYMLKMMAGYTVLIGMVPITFGILVKQQILLRKYQSEAGVIEARLNQQGISKKEEIQNNPNQPEIIIKGENQNELLKLNAMDWLAAEASDNYTRIYYLKNNHSASVLFRCTLIKTEQALASHPNCFRCHKSYLVNIARVAHISGNAQGYRLHLTFMDETIPVSRALNAAIKEKLTAR